MIALVELRSSVTLSNSSVLGTLEREACALRVVTADANYFAAIGFDGSHAREAVAVGSIRMREIVYIPEAKTCCGEKTYKARGLVIQ